MSREGKEMRRGTQGRKNVAKIWEKLENFAVLGEVATT
jgi:hypothetical protein